MSEPGLFIEFDDGREVFQPGETLSGQCRLDGCEGRTIKVVELSVLWHTEGKGDEDQAIHHYEARRPSEGAPLDPGGTIRFATRLPRSPLSYDGLIVKIRWSVRVKAVISGWRDRVGEAPFHLGTVASAGESSS